MAFCISLSNFFMRRSRLIRRSFTLISVSALNKVKKETEIPRLRERRKFRTRSRGEAVRHTTTWIKQHIK
jgi:hypothetical protein